MKATLKTIELYNEVEQKTMRLIVSNDDYKVLRKLEYCGDFRRFELSIAEKEKQGERQKNEMLNFLYEIFKNRSLIESYFK